jgi:glycosyltransferase involved in cell wall biosynthesis
LKVLFITPWYPTKRSVIEGIFVREHAKAVQAYDDVVLFHIPGHDQEVNGWWEMRQEYDKKLTEGVPTYRIGARRSSIPKISYLIYVWSIIQALRQISTWGFQPDIVHAHTYEAALPAMIICKLYRIPFVVTEHSSEFPRRMLSRTKIWKARIAFKSAALVMPVSDFLRQSIQAHRVKGRFCVVPNAVDTSLFQPKQSLPCKRSTKHLLAVCPLDRSHNKGVPHLLRAGAELGSRRQDWHLNIVGDGPAKPEYESMVEALGLRSKVTFCGLKSKHEVAEYMRNSDLFILPSIVETFSVVAAEALSTGIPVLTTRCGGPNEYVNDKVGLAVPKGDAKALYEGIDYMLDNLKSFSADSISEYGASLFSPECVGRRIHHFYRTCIGKRG